MISPTDTWGTPAVNLPVVLGVPAGTDSLDVTLRLPGCPTPITRSFTVSDFDAPHDLSNACPAAP